MLSMDEVKEYNNTKRNFSKDENLIKRICAISKQVTKFFVYGQVYHF